MDPIIAASSVWLWENVGKELIKSILIRFGKDSEGLIESGWKKFDWFRASTKYRKEMEYKYGQMKIFGMNDPVMLDDIFTDVYLRKQISSTRRHTVEESHTHPSMHISNINKDERIEGKALVEARDRLIILGQPGSGKTTFLKHLVMESVQEKIKAIPIFVSLKEWSDKDINLMSFLAHTFSVCNFTDTQPFIRMILERGEVLVLFDGLDEVNIDGGKRARIINEIRDFLQQYRKSKIVLTCRPAAMEYTFEQFTLCEMADFSEEQIDVFVAGWFHSDDYKRSAFMKALKHPDNDRLLELAQRPLFLTMLCITFEETMAFPQRRAELYEEAIDALLKKWDVTRNIQRDMIYRNLLLGYKRQLLMEVAAEAFENSEFMISKRELIKRVDRFLRRLPPGTLTEEPDGEIVLKAIEAQHGLIIEQARDIYSFSHMTFHEYFTAFHI